MPAAIDTPDIQRGVDAMFPDIIDIGVGHEAVVPAVQDGNGAGYARQARLVRAAGEFRARLGGRTVWNVSSTAAGGGVAEMLQVLVGYAEDLGVAVGWGSAALQAAAQHQS